MTKTGQTDAFKVRLTQRFMKPTGCFGKKACGLIHQGWKDKSFQLKAEYMSAILISV